MLLVLLVLHTQKKYQSGAPRVWATKLNISNMPPFLRIWTALAVACNFYYIISQTRLMSASLFPDYSHYDATYLQLQNNSRTLGESSDGSSTQQKSRLPKWLQDYFDWHVATRKKYPGDKILTDPNAPGVLIKACAYKCGGLHDRLGKGSTTC